LTTLSDAVNMLHTLSTNDLYNDSLRMAATCTNNQQPHLRPHVKLTSLKTTFPRFTSDIQGSTVTDGLQAAT